MRKIGMLVSLAAAFGMVFAVSITLTKEGTHLLPEDARSMVKVGNYLYIAAGMQGLLIYDVSDSLNVFPVGAWRPEGDQFTFWPVVRVLEYDGELMVFINKPNQYKIYFLDITSPTDPTVDTTWTYDSDKYPRLRDIDILDRFMAIGIYSVNNSKSGVRLINLEHLDETSFWWSDTGYNIEGLIVCPRYVVITQWNEDTDSGRIVSLEYDEIDGEYLFKKYEYSLGNSHPYDIVRGYINYMDTTTGSFDSPETTTVFYVALDSLIGVYKLLSDGTIDSVGTWEKADTTDHVRQMFRYTDRLFLCNFEKDSTNISGIIVVPIDTATWMPTDTIAVYPARYIRAVWADSTRAYYIGDMSKGAGTSPAAR